MIRREHFATGRVRHSYRDPSGYVFEHAGRVLRAIDAESLAILTSREGTAALDDLMATNAIVRTRAVTDPDLIAPLRDSHAGAAGFLEHERLWPISFAHEWPVSMLADAALHTLDIQARLLATGLGLKDATPDNIQFTTDGPVLIDVASVARPNRFDVWHALGQFHRMFLYPLVLATRHGWDLRSYFLGSHDGRTPAEMARSIGWWERFRGDLLFDFTLPWLAERRQRGGERRGAVVRETAKAHSSRHEPTSAAAQCWNLARLRRNVARLANAYRPTSVWTTYHGQTSYDAACEAAKQRTVHRWLMTIAPRRVLDAGANQGEYSLMAATTAKHVVAVDSDHDAAEVLYRRIRGSRLPVTPLVADIARSATTIGLRGHERPAMCERLMVDCAMALALVHHLRVAHHLRPELLAELLASLTSDHLIVEFVPLEDPMFQRLRASRTDDYSDFTMDAFRAAMNHRFALVEESAIGKSPRRLLWYRRGR